jgi:hypothetical protein
MAEYIAYQCAKSTETRGNRPMGMGVKAPLTEDGCGYWNTRRMAVLMSEARDVQGKPCTACTRRQRLNEGNTRQAPRRVIERDHLGNFVREREATDAEKRAWAIERARRGNEEEAQRRAYILRREREEARMSKDSNAFEQDTSTIEHTHQTIEQSHEEGEE